MERQNPITSNDAFRALQPEKLAHDYEGIIRALKSLKLANYEQISTYLGWVDINKCARRLSEMERASIIYKPGSKSLTKRNRQAFNYSLVVNGEVSAKPEKMLSGKSVGDFAQALIQKDLFE